MGFFAMRDVVMMSGMSWNGLWVFNYPKNEPCRLRSLGREVPMRMKKPALG